MAVETNIFYIIAAFMFASTGVSALLFMRISILEKRIEELERSVRLQHDYDIGHGVKSYDSY